MSRKSIETQIKSEPTVCPQCGGPLELYDFVELLDSQGNLHRFPRLCPSCRTVPVGSLGEAFFGDLSAPNPTPPVHTGSSAFVITSQEGLDSWFKGTHTAIDPDPVKASAARSALIVRLNAIFQRYENLYDI